MRFLLTVLFLLLVMPAVQAFAQTGYTLDDDLLYRINFGSAEDVRLLLAKGANPNAHSRQKESALNIAIERNDGESMGMATALIEKGADVDGADKSGNPPLVNALRYKQTGIVKTLLSKGADYHIRTAGGASLVDFAKTNGDLESAQILQDLLAKESAYADSLRSPERFNEIVKRYTLGSCAYQYWSYFLASRQSPEKDPDTNVKVNQLKGELYQMILQLQKYYTANSIQAMRKVSAQAVDAVFGQLDSMISNQNRADNGIGRDEDVKNRCDKIVAGLNINLMPTALAAPSSIPPAPVPHSSPGNAPLPVDPSLMPMAPHVK